MKKIKIIYPVLLILTILLFNHCNKHKCHEVVGLDQEAFEFSLVDENSETVIASWETKYDYEDLEFEQELKDDIRGLEIRANGKISFYLIEEIGASFDHLIGKSFTNIYYLYLDAKNKNRETDIDTIMISSEIISLDEDCVPIGFGTTTIVYNDSIYHQGDYTDNIDFLKKS